MNRSTRLVLLAALALVVVSGAALAFLGFRALRAEEIVRRSEAERQARAFARLAAAELDADVRALVTAERAVVREILDKGGSPPRAVVAILDAWGGVVWPPSVDDGEQSLSERVLREQPDLVNALLRAEAMEFREGQPAKAAVAYADLAEALDSPATRARLLYRAARCFSRAGDRGAVRVRCEMLLHAYGSARSETGIPFSILAKVQLLTEAPAEERRAPAEALAADLAGAGLLPDSALHLLQSIATLCPSARLEAALEEARARLRVLRWARAEESQSELWLASWAGWILPRSEGGRIVCASAVGPIPRPETRKKLEELARLQNVSFSLQCGGRWVLPELRGAEVEEPLAGGSARLLASIGDPAILERESRTRRLLLGGLLAVLLLAMSVGGYATVRSVRRELRLAQLKSDFVSNVSHELRTPLTSIRMFSEMLSDPKEPAEAQRREYTEILKRETARLSSLVERILESARLNRGAQAFRFERRDLRDVVGRAIGSFRSLHPEIAVAFAPPAEPVAAVVDGSSIEQVLHNLLDNAAKYSPSNPKAEVNLGVRAGWARIDVRDEGSGIDPADLPGLFQEFRRGSNPLTLRVPGTGLGLALVKRIVEAHQGKVSVESAPGRGSTFTVEIPLCPES
ncbi:MAG TPA: HAMP domain-containing sensor histidine kinase [Planctomycetota bacterium]|nr:HAMP domain-containing sensor histidine kinase [Planctomycetota bacterium]